MLETITMTQSEIIKLLRSKRKAYVGIMPQSTFANNLRRIEAGECKQSTIDEFFAKFGFVKVKEYEAQYEKKTI